MFTIFEATSEVAPNEINVGAYDFIDFFIFRGKNYLGSGANLPSCIIINKK